MSLGLKTHCRAGQVRQRQAAPMWLAQAEVARGQACRNTHAAPAVTMHPPVVAPRGAVDHPAVDVLEPGGDAAGV